MSTASSVGVRVERAAVLGLARRIRNGTLVVHERGRTHTVGAGAPTLHVRVLDDRAWSAVARHGSAGLGEAFFEGWWECDDLVAVLRLLHANTERLTSALDAAARALRPVVEPLGRQRRARRDPNHTDARANIRAHYDVSNQFFELMLDDTMAYSSAYFETPEMSLADASRAKLDRICTMLDLGPGDHVVEIGSGWGSFAVHAASHYGCRVTTTTISNAQYRYTLDRVRAAGLEDHVTVLDRDYRELQGPFDKLVSIEMIEAVPWWEHETFFAACARLLRPGGRMAMQAIVIDDRSFDRAKRANDFIKAHVFPGSCIPSLAAIRDATRSADLRIARIDDFGPHYAETLRRWRANLAPHVSALDHLGLGGDRFQRFWAMYLAYCEVGFDEGHISVVQIALDAPGPPVRHVPIPRPVERRGDTVGQCASHRSTTDGQYCTSTAHPPISAHH